MGGHYTIGQNHLTLAERGNGWALYNWTESPYLGGAREWVGTIQLVRITLPWRSGGMGGHYTIGQNQPPYLGGAWEWVDTIQLVRISNLTLVYWSGGHRITVL